ncbi:thiamine pyrophosphate-binding protein [Paenibacillus thermotolerans]|uniref:thiamine pyrophosphate-binding protein n=1 Tax=Paenibacillus thermotolerans TaxID=3027807 RepID=UPI002368D2DB|nr:MULTISPECIES: thiamine pyrophosphate-binding protein [unclassified Paenibacillus]
MNPSVLERTVDRLQNEPVNADARKRDQGLTVGQFILEQLSAWGVKRIYGVIGDANLFLLDDIAKQNKIQYVPFLDENAAALAASAEAKLTGRIGVVLGTSGPGLANMLNGLGDAYADRVGLLAITGQVGSDKVGTHTKQYIQQQLAVAPIAADSELLCDPDALPRLLHQYLVMSATQGCVTHLSVPKMMYREKVNGAVIPYSAHLHQPLLPPRTDVEDTFRMIAEAERPVFLLGRGAEGLTREAVALAEALGAAVSATMPAKHVFPNAHELFVGGLGLAGSEATSVLMAESDLIAVFGATWWPEEYVPHEARIVQIDAAAGNIGVGHPIARGLVGDLRDILPRFVQLAQAPGGSGREREAWRRRIAAIRAEWFERLDAETRQSGSPIAPQRIMKTIAESVDKEAIIAVDTGDHTLWFNRCFENRGQRVLVSGRWRTLGFAIPAAIAAKLSQPEKQVVAVAGDGGVVQTLMEFKTAARLNLPITVIVLNNGAYAIELNRMELAGLDKSGSLLDNPDFAAIAEACGGRGYKASTVEEFGSCLASALADESMPSLIEVTTAPLKVPHTTM